MTINKLTLFMLVSVLLLGAALGFGQTSWIPAGTNSWGTPLKLGSGLDPQVAMDPSGTSHVVYRNDTGVFHATSTRRGRWATTRLDEHCELASCYAPDIAIGGDGTRLVVWSQLEGNPNSGSLQSGSVTRYARVYVPGAGWQPVTNLSVENYWLDDDARDHVEASVSAAGGILAVSWYDGNRARVVFFDGAWQPVITLGYVQAPDGRFGPPTLAVSPDSGSGLLVWRSSPSLASALCVPWPIGFSCRSLGNIEDARGGSVSLRMPAVAWDGASNAIAVWTQERGYDDYAAFSRRFERDTGRWESAVEILNDPVVDDYAIDVVFGDRMPFRNRSSTTFKRYAHAILIRGYYGNISASTLRDDGQGIQWSEPQSVGTGELPRIEANNSGLAMIVWRRSSNLFASVLHHKGKWSPAVSVQHAPPSSVGRPQLAVAETGDAVIAYDSCPWDGDPCEVWIRSYSQ